MNEKVLKCLYDIKIAIDEIYLFFETGPKDRKAILTAHLPKLKTQIERLIK